MPQKQEISEEEDILERMNEYKHDPTAWHWIKEQEKGQEGEAWMRRVATHLEKAMLSKIKSTGELLIEFMPAMLLWGQDQEYRQGVSNNRVYRMQYGTYGTGYIFLTNQNIYIFSFADLTKKYPLLKQRGFIEAVLVGTLLGMLGERDRREPSWEDQNWVVPYPSIVDAQIVQPKDMGNKCLRIITNALTWDIYPGASLILKAINMARFGQIQQLDSEKLTSPNITSNHLKRLQEMKQLLDAGLISKEEYDTKKSEILSSI